MRFLPVAFAATLVVPLALAAPAPAPDRSDNHGHGHDRDHDWRKYVSDPHEVCYKRGMPHELACASLFPPRRARASPSQTDAPRLDPRAGTKGYRCQPVGRWTSLKKCEPFKQEHHHDHHRVEPVGPGGVCELKWGKEAPCASPVALSPPTSRPLADSIVSLQAPRATCASPRTSGRTRRRASRSS